jgi:hypothetical protein
VFRSHANHLRIAEASYVVNNCGPGFQATARNFGLHRVHGNGNGRAAAKVRDHGDHAAEFFVQRNRLRSGACGFTANVEDIGPLGNEMQGVFHGRSGVGEAAAIGEAIRGDVQNAEHERTWAEGEDAIAEVPAEGVHVIN